TSSPRRKPGSMLPPTRCRRDGSPPSRGRRFWTISGVGAGAGDERRGAAGHVDRRGRGGGRVAGGEARRCDGRGGGGAASGRRAQPARRGGGAGRAAAGAVSGAAGGGDRGQAGGGDAARCVPAGGGGVRAA